MESIEQKILQRLDRLRADIQAAMEANKENASGRTSSSLQVVQYEGGAKLVAAEGDRAPLRTLEVGREGGKVPYKFYLILAQWSRDKGLRFDTERERNTFAYFLGKRIAREGTLRHAKNVDIYSGMTNEAAKDISTMIMASVKEQITSNF